MLQYPLTQQWIALNDPTAAYSALITSLEKCNPVCIFLKLLVQQYSCKDVPKHLSGTAANTARVTMKRAWTAIATCNHFCHNQIRHLHLIGQLSQLSFIRQRHSALAHRKICLNEKNNLDLSKLPRVLCESRLQTELSVDSRLYLKWAACCLSARLDRLRPRPDRLRNSHYSTRFTNFSPKLKLSAFYSNLSFSHFCLILHSIFYTPIVLIFYFLIL